MNRELDPKEKVLRKIDAHREVLSADIGLLRHRLRPFSVIASTAVWFGKALTFRAAPAPRRKRGRHAGSRFDLDTMIWLGLPLVQWFLGRRKKK